jgi:hypothetical protein
MKSSKKTAPIAALLAFCLALSIPMVVSAQEIDSSIAACLKTWGNHPFGSKPQFKTLETSVTVFGIGRRAGDTAPTSSPALVLINPIFNVMGASTIELLNPNGWYCLRTTVSVLGGVNIRAHCKAQLAANSDGQTVRGNNTENRGIKNLGVTVIGAVSIERPCN